MLAAEIEVLRDQTPVYALPVGQHALLVGRAPDNDLVLTDARVSGHHVVIHWDDVGLVIRDLGSRNGTFLNEVAVVAPASLSDGDIIRLGSGVFLRVRIHSVPGTQRKGHGTLMLSDLTTGLAYPLRTDRFRIGRRPDADLRLPSGPALAATVALQDNGEIWVGTDDEQFQVLVGQPFEVARHRLLIRDNRNQDTSTMQESALTRTRYPYRLRVELSGQTGPEATVEDPRTGNSHVIRAENRVVLLYVLAQSVLKEPAPEQSDSERGWCPDEEAMMGIWGKRWESMGVNNYQVLLCRLRKELNDANLDGWFIEKRRGFTRLALTDIVVN